MTAASDILGAYAAEAADLAPRFDALSSRDVLAPILRFLPAAPSDIADIGAGSGRDAGWLTDMGHRVTAVEPVSAFATYGQSQHSNAIEWLEDRLPDLPMLSAQARQFDTVLVASVWHHLSFDQSACAMVALGRLLRPEGRLILSLKVFAQGQADMLSLKTVQDHARAAGLAGIHSAPARSHSDHNRQAGNSWHWLVLESATSGGTT